jgi:peptide-methionine (S)-S-oxide reductase
MGGQLDHPTYEPVCSGRTGHAEAVRITFNPTVVSYRELLEVLFVIHDPMTPNRQGHDVGAQYRSVIFNQEYFSRNQFQGYCTAAVGPEVAKFRKLFTTKLKT